MREKLGLLVCVWFLLYGSSVGRFVVEKNSLKVISPESLKDVYDCTIANLGVGVPQHGGTMFGTVIYPKVNQKACKNFDDFYISFKLRPGTLPIILLADRGDCYFTLKVRNAQDAGASAILVVDDRIEPLITMDTPEEDDGPDDYLKNLTIPSAFITKAFGDNIKSALSRGDLVNINLDLSNSFPHPDERVKYEFWTNSNYECGPKCENQIEFVKNFKGAAQMLEQKGHAQFTPHYITWYCPEAFLLSKLCRSQCINRGRYCALDPEEGFRRGYEGRDVVVQNLREACFFKVANESGKPWLWWDYVNDFAIWCPMKEKKYNKQCADQVIQSLGSRLTNALETPMQIKRNPVLKAEQEAQMGEGTHGAVTISPTLIINNKHYRGKLDKETVLKAICSGFQQTTKPAIYLSEDYHLNFVF
ncbi:hypothetical protein F0562_015222 [Nyssa sinensis]|uniref:Uncharacterized protein n=1 Tax=Nyssa sinensis TaxID=561372 RepID=A0A5J4ZI20_9ASTE|nr:hypothetical protein F0562_015222 [Nyssa sinensis]